MSCLAHEVSRNCVVYFVTDTRHLIFGDESCVFSFQNGQPPALSSLLGSQKGLNCCH